MICEYEIISTGSQGNAVALDQSILIDCGVPFKALRAHYRGLRLVLLTHIHSDHFNRSTLRTLARERPTLRFGCGPWLAADLAACGVDKANIDIMKDGMRYDYGSCAVEPVPLIHDVPNCGYKLHFPSCKVFYATDTSSLAHIEAKNYDLYLVEANHLADEIRERIRQKRAAGEYSYEYEAMHNHLSLEKCNDFIYSNIGPGGQYAYLHCHQDRGETEG